MEEIMNPIIESLGNIGIVPVIKIDDADKAVPLAKALIAGGIPCAEVTFRTAQGEEAIRRIHKEAPDMCCHTMSIGRASCRERV
jgi:2-dehydro-3-deoxyphosphogluconate aldolase/(4S)-4-hydroxy-2-oxoglutarate aldolase